MRRRAITLAVITAAGCASPGVEPAAAPADPEIAPAAAAGASAGTEPGTPSAGTRPTDPPPPDARETRSVSHRSRSVSSVTAGATASEQQVTVATSAGSVSARSRGGGIEVDLTDAPGWRSSQHEAADGTITVTWARTDEPGDDDRVEVVLTLRDGSIVTRTSSVTTSGGASR